MNDNMQDILKNYYATGGKTLFEQTEPEELDEGVIINTALIVGALASMLAQVPDVNPAKNDLQAVAQELLQKELQSPQVTPAVINSPTHLGLAFGVSESDLSDVSKITNDFTRSANYQSATTNSHTYEVSENLLISVTRVSKEFIEMPDRYNTTCVIDALYTLNGESQAATEMVEFNHSHMGDWADMKSCDVPSLVKIVKDKMSNREFVKIPNTQVESAENRDVVDASDIFLHYSRSKRSSLIPTPKQKDDWLNMEAQVFRNIPMYGTTAPQTIGLVRKELAKLGINITIDAITPRSSPMGRLEYSTPDIEPFYGKR